MTIKEFNQGLIDKKFTIREIIERYYKRIEEKDGKIKAYLSLFKEKSLKKAEGLDQKLEKEPNLAKKNPLYGIPLAIKDNILIEGEKTTAGSKMLENYTATYDATVIKKLKVKEVIFLGKTNLDEFAIGSSTENSAFHITHNPLDLSLVPGGSSGGSAAAVSADMAIATLGSDTGGSIRQPAGFCGVVGLKPTYGAVSRFGGIAMASSLDQIGPITKNVEDAEILFNAIKGKDPLDSTSVEFKDQKLKAKNQNYTIGLPKEFFEEGSASKEVRMAINKTIEELKEKGIKFKEISFPFLKYALPCYYIIMPAEVSSNLARYDNIRYGKVLSKENAEANLNWKEYITKVRTIGFGQEVKRRIILGIFVLSHGYYDAYYLKASKVRKMIKEKFQEIFKEVDLILTPTSPTLPFKIGEKTKDPLSMYLSDIFTVPINLAGLPAISIPTKENKMVGFQLIGPAFSENLIFEVGKLYEKPQAFHKNNE